MNSILIVEDNDDLREITAEAISSRGDEIITAASAEEAFSLIKERSFDLVITDLKLPEADGMAVLEAVKNSSPDTEVIIMTAYGTVDTAVKAMKKGASDFITKPFSIEQMRVLTDKIMSHRALKEENRNFKKITSRMIIGNSEKIKEVTDLAAKVADKEVIILLTGESGTGKELIAEEIHRKSRRGAQGALVKVNCAALAPGVLESELFGHEKGAFTDAMYMKKGRFELADKGTIFLDEIAELAPDMQVKLLRVLQNMEFERVGSEKTIRSDARVITATNRDLKQAVADGLFREDLYYRLNVMQIHIPALRDRKEDIPELTAYFIKKYAEYGGYKVKAVSKSALDILMKYDFPGNVRELENLIQRILVTCNNDVIEPEDLPYEIRSNTVKESGTGFDNEVEAFEKKKICDALTKSGGNKSKAAEILGINRTTFLAKVKKLGIE
ncbi:MAG: sigma-54-dependent Fis family transcriptional regulator [Candidatus Goldbacteria bacterium]|nr:sigma-54-dependent Fis family transcriptional regulator [Candidatus Goldiibacteriota bacterium]